jgi:transposase
MITLDMLGKVRRMKMRDSLTISEISKRTGLSRNTVKRWLRAPGGVSARYLLRTELCSFTVH